VSAAALAGCALIVLLIVRRHSTGHHVEDEQGVGVREAIRLLIESRHLRVLALVVGFAAAGAAVVDQQVKMWADATHADPDSIAAFLSTITFYVSLAGFVVQIALTSRHPSLARNPLRPLAAADRTRHERELDPPDRKRLRRCRRPRSRYRASLFTG
jgi:hypothetical protein